MSVELIKSKIPIINEKRKLILSRTYELTAKLLASEDINVVFTAGLPAPALFDLKNRVLKINKLEDEHIHLTMGLVVHEVGHALYTIMTPSDINSTKGISTVMNALEDGYQERQMCKHYPGVKHHLRDIFDYFFIEADIKETIRESLNRPNGKVLAIVNTLIYNCKGLKYGKELPYPSFMKSKHVNEIKDAELLNDYLYSDRRKIAKRVSEIIKFYMDKADDDLLDDDSHDGQNNQEPPLLEDEDDSSNSQSDEAGNGGEPGDEDENTGEGEGESGDSGDDGDSGDPEDNRNGEGETEGDPDESSSGSGKESEINDNDNDTGSDIDDIINENQDLSVDHHDKLKFKPGSGEYEYELASPDCLLDNIVITDIDMLGSDSRSKRIEQEFKNNKIKEANRWKEDSMLSKRTATRIFNQFNMRKSAQELAKTAHHKSGNIDPLRLSQYQIDDDIFRRHEVMPEQTNHAYVVMLDWSGSMDSSVFQLTHRIMELTYFAIMAEVELEVWTYTTGTNSSIHGKSYPGMAWNNSKMTKVLNTKTQNRVQVNNNLRSLWAAAKVISTKTGIDFASNGISTAGTNILESVVLGHGILDRMRAQKKSLFVLSDGSDEQHFTSFIKKDGSYSQCADSFFGRGPANEVTYNGQNPIDYIRNVYGMDTTPRSALTRMVNDSYSDKGHKTLGITWNVLDNTLINLNSFLFGETLCANGKGNQTVYQDLGNDFISVIIDHLL